MSDSPKKVRQIVGAIEAAFPDEGQRESPDLVEKLMRPFAPISEQTEGAIESLLGNRGKHTLFLRVNGWIEANAVVQTPTEYPGVEARIRFLCMDTCTCVLEHLPEAIKHAKGPVHPIVLALSGKGDTSAQGKNVLASEIRRLFEIKKERRKASTKK